MSILEEPLHRSLSKTRRVSPAFRRDDESLAEEAPTRKEKAVQWLQAHPWSILGVTFGVSGLLGFTLGVRS